MFKKIKLSKNQWQSIGEKAGWTKEAQPVPFTEELVRENMLTHGQASLNSEDTINSFDTINSIMSRVEQNGDRMDNAVFLMFLRNECQNRLDAIFGNEPHEDVTMGWESGNPEMTGPTGPNL